MIKNLCLIVFLAFISLSLEGQKIDNTISYRDIEREGHFRLHYDNDFFVETDRNYTQGYQLEWAAPLLRKNPINYILLKRKQTDSKFGIALEGFGFTPENLESSEIQIGDRPYAAVTVLKSFAIYYDKIKRHRISSSFAIGMIGPVNLGRETQVFLHELTDSAFPKGWHHQIQNDVVLNYGVRIEKNLLPFEILSFDKTISLDSESQLNVGSLFTNFSTGFIFKIGLLKSDKFQKIKIYVYAHPWGKTIFYDATLQGGLLNRQNSYTISSSNIKRLGFQFDAGLVLKIHGFYFEYAHTWLTPEFEGGENTAWGGLRLGFGF